ncbi:unnamed protein product [Knipowitschia caucasica]
MPKPPKANETGESSLTSGNTAVLQAIDALKSELLSKIDDKAEMQKNELAKQIRSLRDEVKASIEQANNRVSMLEERMASLEEGTNTCSDGVTELEQQVAELNHQILSLTEKTEDLEARSRRDNLRIFGIKEGREGGAKVSTFIAELLQHVLNLATPPVIDRAHRTSPQTTKAGPNQPPRAFVVKCHYFQEKEAILRKAASKKLVSKDGDTIRMFPDFTQSVARQRAAFGPARQILRQCEGVKYGLLYPARLKITTPDGVQQMFSDPVKATAFAKGLMAP